jgi:hypothetical protein
MRAKDRIPSLSSIALAVPADGLGPLPAAQTAMTYLNWPAYLHGPAHSWCNAGATAFTPANSGALAHDWTWAPAEPTQTGQPSGLEASPTVVNGVVRWFRDEVLGSGTGRLDMLATDYGAPVPAGTAGGLPPRPTRRSAPTRRRRWSWRRRPEPGVVPTPAARAGHIGQVDRVIAAGLSSASRRRFVGKGALDEQAGTAD